MLTKLATITLVAVISLSPPIDQDQAQEIAALRRQVQELRDQQTQMQQELTAIKNFLQALMKQAQGQGAAQEPDVPGLIGATVPTAGEPVLGSRSARITIMEVSDYQCPFCRKQALETLSADRCRVHQERQGSVHVRGLPDCAAAPDRGARA